MRQGRYIPAEMSTSILFIWRCLKRTWIVSAKFKAPAAYLMQIFVDPQYALPLTELAAEHVHFAVLGKATTQICQFYRWLHV